MKRGNLMKTYHIYLYRHGETEANEKGYYAGTTEVPLSEKGKKQLLELKNKYYYPYGDMIFTSPRIRCLETLEIIYPERNATMMDDLAECDFGDYEGKSMAELAEEEDYQKWSSGALDCPPNGEKSKDFQLRTCRAFETIVRELMTSQNSSAIIMAHGGSIMTILGTYGFPRRPMYEWTCESGMGYELLITPNLWMSGKAFEVSGYVPLAPGEREGDLSDEFAYFNEELTNDDDDEDYDDGDLVEKAEQEEIDNEEDY